jgi:hypothetical protein
VARDGYVDDREASQALIREGLAARALWVEAAARPVIGEVHVDAAAGTTLYTRDGGVAVRVGHGDAVLLRARMARFDVVWRALAESREKPRMILVDQRAHPERVTVKLAGVVPPVAPAPVAN